ncbi:unnamed protein product [Discosporangium mesarthrocarpum]
MYVVTKIKTKKNRWNCDFSRVGHLPLRRINELEVAVLQVLQYNVRVASSLFARQDKNHDIFLSTLVYYFRLRHWMMILGVETPGVYEASPPKRRGVGLGLGPEVGRGGREGRAGGGGCGGGGWAAAGAAVAAGNHRTARSPPERDSMLQIAGPLRRQARKAGAGKGSKAMLSKVAYTSPYCKLPLCLEELVHMQQTYAGGRLGHYSEKMCSELARKMLSAVRHCHANGICHRDLKLENWVFESLAPDAELKLIDFGLSKHFGKDEVMHVPVGTPYTIAPECLSGAYTQACDLWSLGVLVFMLLCGEPPFTGKDDFEVLASVKAAKWKWAKGTNVSADAKDFVSRLLVLDPNRRLTAEEALEHRWLQQASQPKPELPNHEVMASLQEFESLCTIKKLVLQMIAYTLEAWQVESLRREFQKLDKNCNGLITLHDLKAALNELGLLSAGGEDCARLGKMFETASGPGQAGVLRYNDFLAASLMSMKEHQTLDESILKAVFDKFDCGHIGRITGHDLRRFLGKELDDEDIDRLMREAGLDHGGSMDFKEFKDLMRSSLSSPPLSRGESCPLPSSMEQQAEGIPV